MTEEQINETGAIQEYKFTLMDHIKIHIENRRVMFRYYLSAIKEWLGVEL